MQQTPGVSPREHDVVLSYGQVGNAHLVAAQLGMSRNTVRAHLASARSKAYLTSSTVLAVTYALMQTAQQNPTEGVSA